MPAESLVDLHGSGLGKAGDQIDDRSNLGRISLGALETLDVAGWEESVTLVLDSRLVALEEGADNSALPLLDDRQRRTIDHVEPGELFEHPNLADDLVGQGEEDLAFILNEADRLHVAADQASARCLQAGALLEAALIGVGDAQAELVLVRGVRLLR